MTENEAPHTPDDEAIRELWTRSRDAWTIGDTPGLVDDGEIPVLQGDVGRRPCAQHREVVHEVLARRDEPGPG